MTDPKAGSVGALDELLAEFRVQATVAASADLLSTRADATERANKAHADIVALVAALRESQRELAEDAETTLRMVGFVDGVCVLCREMKGYAERGQHHEGCDTLATLERLAKAKAAEPKT